MTPFARRRVTAVLGPTNTGKTYLAIERMLGHASGMIGFPLRLLARENYDRVVKIKGAGQVALVTGEEKIVPPGARYFLCTVESMPVDRATDFLGVDEIQLCADPERGHVFTDRLLHARGTQETMFMGADTLRTILRKLVPEAETISRPRFSTLAYTGECKLSRLPPRSTVVAFSAAEVYETAELMRRQRGGTAVVMGALSPRTRRAQVGMFEAGEVDYLVATDAIGMGLNLDLEHVAFAKLSKFDGQTMRPLGASEIAQIAGRAGRHMTDGSFGTTNDIGPIDPKTIEAVEEHRFDPHDTVFWRARDLNLRSPGALLTSLERHPPSPILRRASRCDDLRALSALAREPDILDLARNPGAVGLLWEVCQIPDFQKILSDRHTRLLSRIYRNLMAGGLDAGSYLPTDWVAQQIARIDRCDGDIDTLVARIAQVRTWTYVSHRADWLADPQHWQERTRAIEDKLSDALHERLTARFVDRRAAVLVRRLRTGDEMLAAIKADGIVLVEGEFVGRLHGFRFQVDEAVTGGDAQALLTAARRALLSEIPRRLRALERAPAQEFALLPGGGLTWRGEAVGGLGAGDTALTPIVEPLSSEFLDSRARERLRLCLAAWLQRHLRARLMPLYRVCEAATQGEFSGPARGLLYQLGEALGVIPRDRVGEQLRAIGKAERKRLAALGVRLGRVSVYMPALRRSGRPEILGLLWSAHRRTAIPAFPAHESRTCLPAPDADESFYLAVGYCCLPGFKGPRLAIRAEALEHLAQEVFRLSQNGPFRASARLHRLVDGDAARLETALRALRYDVRQDTEGLQVSRRRGRAGNGANGRGDKNAGPAKKSGPRQVRKTNSSPFDILRELTPGE